MGASALKESYSVCDTALTCVFDEAVLQGLAEVLICNGLGAGKIGDGPGDADDAVKRACREMQPFG